MALRLGGKVPNSGPLPLEVGIPTLARALEDAGFDSLWVSDHVVMPREVRSRYPFSPDGRPTWPAETPYVDAIVALALMAAATERPALGTAVLVLPLRQPVVAAKQLASIDIASGGRLCLGVGSGWLREEFEALNVPFQSRGSRFEEWIELLRRCWTGRPEPFQGVHYTLPPGVLALPAPGRAIPILIGGHGERSLRRAGALGDGWLAHQSLDGLDPEEIARARRRMAEAAHASGRDAEALRVVLRVIDAAGRSGELASRLPELIRAGVDEIVVDVDWNAGDPRAELERLREAGG
ncbi:MAG TPA: TIGR03619 family F420-dependent LLM class oxidoreductase [Gaiellaceae bacterium]|nr:TIGR03619 family F420-dependent LLM class oxidoreductase [Gaiellaceae bacterium]